MLNADWLVQVYARDKDGDPCIGTGYSIGNGLVLTARHVVRFDKRHADPCLKLVWPEQNKHEMLFADADIVFDGFTCEPKIDVAVIRCPQTTPFKPPQIEWFPIDPMVSTAWASRGFPRAGKEAMNRNDLGVPGKVAGLKKHVMELTTEVDATEANGWGGFSGAPVFIGRQLVAVITHDYLTVGRYFKAVSIPWLLQNNQNFCEAMGLDENALICQRFLEKQREQVKQYLVLIESSGFLKILGNKLLVQELKSSHLIERLFAEFDTSALALLDIALKASIEALNQEVDKVLVANQVKKLFFLLVSLMTPYSSVARDTIMNLPVRTRMATELQLAQHFDANPTFELGLDGHPKGCFAEDASVFVREMGWDINRQVDEAAKVIYKHVYKRDAEQSLDEFERDELNETIKQRQNRDFSKIHRIELNEGDATMKNNPFANPDFCTILKSTDYLPNFPIVYYGKAIAPNEAKLRAKLRELFDILEPYGYTP